MQIPVEEIRIRKRIRRDAGDLRPLMESMQKHGLVNPIVVTEKRELVAGFRRLESAKRLGWESIPAQIVENLDDISLFEIEVEENTARKDFTSDEMADAIVRMERLQNPGFLRRLWRAIVRFFDRLFGIFARRRR